MIGLRYILSEKISLWNIGDYWAGCVTIRRTGDLSCFMCSFTVGSVCKNITLIDPCNCFWLKLYFYWNGAYCILSFTKSDMVTRANMGTFQCFYTDDINEAKAKHCESSDNMLWIAKSWRFILIKSPFTIE